MDLIEFLEWDTNFFGIKVARLCDEAEARIKDAFDICIKENVRLLICRTSTDNIGYVHELERHGFELMDTVTRYRLYLNAAQLPLKLCPAIIRPCRSAEVDNLAAIATEVYVNHIGHFHQDPKLDRNKATAMYAEMARNSYLEKKADDIVLVARLENAVVGFHSHKVVPGNGIAGIISGVSPDAQGKGIGKALIVATIEWGKSQGLEWIEEYPHINHPSMHKIMSDLGFRLQSSSYTLHKWFNKE